MGSSATVPRGRDPSPVLDLQRPGPERAKPPTRSRSRRAAAAMRSEMGDTTRARRGGRFAIWAAAVAALLGTACREQQAPPRPSSPDDAGLGLVVPASVSSAPTAVGSADPVDASAAEDGA